MKIVVLDGYTLNPGDLSWEPLEELGTLTVYDRTAPKQLIERAAGAEVLLTNKTVIDADAMAQLPALKYIGVLATGYNVVDIEAARKLGIIVTNVPAYSTDSVAQMVFAHLLAVTSRVEHYAAENRRGRWSDNPDFSYTDTPLREFRGKRFGIVGMGNIGMRVATIARAFGMEVAAFTSRTDLPEWIARTELDELFSTCDVVSLHCPLTDRTRHLVDARRLSLMKRDAILINTARGPLIDEPALAEALNSGRIYAAALDVLSQEPPAPDNPLLSARNCYITPHIAWASTEAREHLMKVAVGNVRAYVEGTPVNCVNAAAPSDR